MEPETRSCGGFVVTLCSGHLSSCLPSYYSLFLWSQHLSSFLENLSAIAHGLGALLWPTAENMTQARPCGIALLGEGVQEQHWDRKLSELMKAGLQVLISLSISFCFTAPLQLLSSSSLPQVWEPPPTFTLNSLSASASLGSLLCFVPVGLSSPFPPQKKPIARSWGPRWQQV